MPDPKTKTTPELRGLWRVRAGFYLHFPSSIQTRDRLWLTPGGVVDLDDGYIRTAVEGQEFKLEKAPAGAEASPLKDRRLVNEREDWLARQAGTKRAPAKKAKRERATVAADSTGIPEPDERPEKKP